MNLIIPGGMEGNETHPDIKAIVSSGYSNDPIMADCRTYGFSDVISKPYRITDLGETLHAILQNKASGLRKQQS